MSPGQLLSEARRRHGVSQERLAIRAGTTQSAISRIERGGVSPSVETLGGLLHLLGEDLLLATEPRDWGIDRTLIRERLRLTPSEQSQRPPRRGHGVIGEPLPPKAPDLRALLQPLVEHGVDFVVIGGMAGIALGSNYPSFDLDVMYDRGQANVRRLVAALEALDVRLRGAPPDLPFLLDSRTIENGANFTFVTPHGDIVVLTDAAGVKGYAALAANAVEREIAGFPVKIASIDDLIAMKRAANRPKDRNMLEEYIVIADELRRAETGSAG